MVSGGKSRISPEFEIMIHEIKLNYLKAGRKPPSNEKITKMIANDIKKRGVIDGEFISFK